MEKYQNEIINWLSSPMAGKSYIFNKWAEEQKTQKELRAKTKNNKVKGIEPNFIIIDEFLY